MPRPGTQCGRKTRLITALSDDEVAVRCKHHKWLLEYQVDIDSVRWASTTTALDMVPNKWESEDEAQPAY